MKIINTKLHGVLDYLMGILLVASPYLLNFADGTLAHHLPVAFGVTILAISLFTDYEPGLVKAIPMKAHLIFDFFSGLFLLASPWIFAFDNKVYLPYVILGAVEMASALLTKTMPSYSAKTAHRYP